MYRSVSFTTQTVFQIVHDDHAPLLVTNRDDCPPYETVVRV